MNMNRLPLVMALMVATAILACGIGGAQPTPKMVSPQKHVRSVDDLYRRALNLSDPALAEVNQAVEQGDMLAAWRALHRHFRERREPKDPQVGGNTDMNGCSI